MHEDNLKALAELRDFVTRLRAKPGVTAKLRVGQPATAKDCRPYEGILAPELLEWARAANGLRLEWHQQGALQGAFHVPTLRQFSQSKEQHGLEVTDDEVIQKFNLAGQGDFVCMVGSSDGPMVFDGDYVQPLTVGSLADVVRAGIRASFRPGWERELNANRPGDAAADDEFNRNPFGIEGWEEALASAKPDPAEDARLEAISKAEAAAQRAAIKEVASRSWAVPAPPRPHPTAKNPLTVLECGVDSGGVSVVAIFKPETGWRFIAKKSEGLGDDDWPTSSWESDSFRTLQEALRLIDAYDWWSFHPLIVAEQFREEVMASIEGRTRVNPSPSMLELWRKAPSSSGRRRAAARRRA